MRFLVTGARGMLGQDMVAALAGRAVVALSHDDLDITDTEAVCAMIQPGDVIINCAAYNAVDLAESERDAAFAINESGPRILATAARDAGARLVHVSTDYVLAGEGTEPHPEDERPAPLSVYGESKAAGEAAVLELLPESGYVVRTAWLYGAGGNNFAKTMIRLAHTNESVPVVTDQRGQPTWTADLAEQIVRLIDRTAPAGVYHGTNAGAASWFEFAQAVLASVGMNPDTIVPTTSETFVRPARRPQNSVLGHDRWVAADLAPMRDWRAALHAATAADVFTDVTDPSE